MAMVTFYMLWYGQWEITQNTAITLLASATTATTITLWSRVLLEKLTSSQLVKKLCTFDRTKRFFTALQVPTNCSCPEPGQIGPCPPHPTSWRSILGSLQSMDQISRPFPTAYVIPKDQSRPEKHVPVS